MENQVNPSMDEFNHHGIKGMHWGVRNRPVGGTLKPGRATGEIRVARRNVRAAGNAAFKAQMKRVVGKSSKQEVREKKLAFLMHPDRATAARLTRGETVASALLLQPEIIASSQVRSRLITSRQKDGYLNSRGKIRVNLLGPPGS